MTMPRTGMILLSLVVFASPLLSAPVNAAEKPSGNSAGKNKAKPVADPLVKQVNDAIEVSKYRFLTANVHTPWQIMHGFLALRQDYTIKNQKGKKIRAIDFISSGAAYRGQSWFQKTRYGGRAHPYSTDYIFEGHPCQFLAILSMANLPLTHKLKADRGTITIADMVNNAKAEVNSDEEITWVLWALSHYLGPDARWENKYGEAWSIERLVRLQTQAPAREAACGGTHGLFALTYARNVYLKTGRPLRGVWLAADQKIKRYIVEAKASQNADGTFSTNYFERRGYSNSFEKRLNTSGHTLEFLLLAVPKKRLKEEWVRKAVKAIARDLTVNRRVPAKCASLYHALDGLVLYRDIVAPRPKKSTGATGRHAVKAPKPRARSIVD